jgi:hypothetical protein
MIYIKCHMESLGKQIVSYIHCLKHAINLVKRTVIYIERLRNKKERKRKKKTDHSKPIDLSRNGLSIEQVAFVHCSSLEKLSWVRSVKECSLETDVSPDDRLVWREELSVYEMLKTMQSLRKTGLTAVVAPWWL